MGMLTIKVNGCKMTFGGCLDDKLNYVTGDYSSFCSTSGCVRCNSEGVFDVEHGEWYYDGYTKLPDVIKDNIDEVMELFNEHVPYGCCGGCI